MSKFDRTTWQAMGYIWLVWTRPDGGVSTCGPFEHDVNKAVMEAKHAMDGSNIAWTTMSGIPQDRTWRDAWKQDAQKVIAIDLEKAKDIQAEQIMTAYQIQTEKLAADKAKAKLKGDVAKMGSLDDELAAMQAAIDNLDVSKAKTLEELAAMWPVMLVK